MNSEIQELKAMMNGGIQVFYEQKLREVIELCDRYIQDAEKQYREEEEYAKAILRGFLCEKYLQSAKKTFDGSVFFAKELIKNFINQYKLK